MSFPRTREPRGLVHPAPPKAGTQGPDASCAAQGGNPGAWCILRRPRRGTEDTTTVRTGLLVDEL
ncbi:MAG: hypothetical protein EOM24_11045 [Chloroflexia bacterium]|nr:hypothetical protein [Chloroflexia bacterium]